MPRISRKVNVGATQSGGLNVGSTVAATWINSHATTR
jgi:hypothetical protein